LSPAKDVRVCVANDELRTGIHRSMGEKGSIVEVQAVPMESYGWQWRPPRRDGEQHARRLSARAHHPHLRSRLKAQDQFYGESLMGYGYGRLLTTKLVERAAKEYPLQFPFRTDYANDQLPWFQLKTVKPRRPLPSISFVASW